MYVYKIPFNGNDLVLQYVLKEFDQTLHHILSIFFPEQPIDQVRFTASMPTTPPPAFLTLTFSAGKKTHEEEEERARVCSQ